MNARRGCYELTTATPIAALKRQETTGDALLAGGVTVLVIVILAVAIYLVRP
jgi:hypothetical protein